MKLLPLIFLVAGITSALKAEDYLPKCSHKCIMDGAKSVKGCDANDIKCLCDNHEAVAKKSQDCVLKECGMTKALNEVIPAVEKLCKEAEKESS